MEDAYGGYYDDYGWPEDWASGGGGEYYSGGGGGGYVLEMPDVPLFDPGYDLSTMQPFPDFNYYPEYDPFVLPDPPFLYPSGYRESDPIYPPFLYGGTDVSQMPAFMQYNVPLEPPGGSWLSNFVKGLTVGGDAGRPGGASQIPQTRYQYPQYSQSGGGMLPLFLLAGLAFVLIRK